MNRVLSSDGDTETNDAPRALDPVMPEHRDDCAIDLVYAFVSASSMPDPRKGSPCAAYNARMTRSVSVIVPCYNYAHYLTMCVESVLDQESVDVRVLVIDDCSTDETPVVGARLAADPR